MVRKIVISALILAVLLGAVAFYTRYDNHSTENNGVPTVASKYLVVLFPGPQRDVSILGSYLSQSRYSMSELYANGSSLFLSPFLWNVRTALGVTNMTLTPYLNVTVKMTQITKITPSIPVDGYPGLMYGEEGWFPFAGKTLVSPLLPLPEKISDLPQFYSILKFRVFQNLGVIQDFSYDIWLTRDPNTTYLKYGDFEVMIWMYGSDYITQNKYFIFTGYMTFPVLVNGTLKNMSWAVYVLPRTGSATGWTGVYLLPPQNLQGTVGIPITHVLQNLNPYLQRANVNYNESYYLDAIQVGMEFNDSSGTADLGYTLYSWYLNFSQA
ncbi:GH12 family glycosyl hydrolase domain-containing protein [Metallosphaera javensis (ex Sakai et al. 2022)]|uniref:GH12 family glycosyl hydrolase domain-containing protein n=1 Tax=Metallosphaera javensis (ex Sakai et al. 2022) TaxID=2775498 RepID=UPI00258846ED|nr:MAG: extracellular endo-1,4-beta-glucanase (EC 3.2.1.4) [Metallosphaera javensis (ex Sakai et al. 2022)]